MVPLPMLVPCWTAPMAVRSMPVSVLFKMAKAMDSVLTTVPVIRSRTRAHAPAMPSAVQQPTSNRLPALAQMLTSIMVMALPILSAP